ncbi:MAG: chromosome segregation SMC family protein [Candidatus Aenigmatarchaeota archaeon]
MTDKKTFISKITIQGFKSFNKRISIPLANSFNIFCGPNGVGKSNIVDAICFVLGRTSAKSLRADRLHELIFHGSDTKQPAQYASVTLFLDNSTKAFPFDDSEITITRKVNRNGVSIYKLNGRNTTREKILEVLSLARIHPNGHNIVLQGDITEIIEMSPIERREIIDEISGIAEYNEKKSKAQKDLEQVEQKLKEAEIVISQRYDIYKRLEEERNAAIRYQQLTRQLTTLKASYAYKKFILLQEELNKINEALMKKEEQSKKIKEDFEKVEKELEEKEKNIRDIANQLINLSKRVEIEKEVSEIRSQILIKKDKLETNLREIERLDSLIEKLLALESKKAEFIGAIPKAVEAVLKLNLKGVYGAIANLISVPERYQVAIEVAAGPHLYDIVTENDDVAAYCIEFLKREKIGRATFLPLNKIKPTIFKEKELLNKEGVIGIASKLIKFNPKFEPAIEFVFGNTLVVKNLNVAKVVGIGKARMVTLDGDLIERSGAMVGGYYIKTHPQFIETITTEEIEKYRELRKSLMKEVDILKNEIAELEKDLKKKAVEETTKEFISLEKLRITSEREIDELREKKKKLYQKSLNLELEINQLKIEQAKLETELNNARVEKEKYGNVQYVDEKLHVLENLIKKTEKELENIGPVNLKAIEEFEKFRTEFDEYKKRYEKILEEKKAVLDMIEQIESKKKEIFNKTLSEVSNYFNSIFMEMVGGTASLTLEDPNNIESGLLIQVNPKGKKLLNIDALSGGEKSLSALAFIFAIQKYKPAPFYILDEVDAALDKENSIKIAEYIKNLSKRGQFIMITHNDQTIKYGDRIFGVTMEEGESKILGLEMPKIIG